MNTVNSDLTSDSGVCTVQTALSFTPGPWRADGLFVRSDRGDYVCDIKFPDDDPEVIANARLIAAAPDLLEALQVVAGLNGFEPHEPYGMLVEAAIAKATEAA